MKVSAILVVGIMILVFVVSGCGSNYQFPDIEDMAGVSVHEMVTVRGIIRYGSKDFSVDYSLLKVYEDPYNEEGVINLPVLRIISPALHKEDPVFILHGGPGTPNIKDEIPDYLLLNHDVVIIGYRGVDGSVKLDCPSVSKVLKEIDDDISSEFLQELADAFVRDAAVYKSQGINPDSYTMMEVIEDLEAARKALKYDKINLMSFSYGTRLAYLYSQKYPKSINRSVMVSVNPPGRFVWEPEKIDEQLEYYNQLWKQNPVNIEKCPDLVEAIRDSLENMPEKWLFVKLNRAKVRILAFMLLYHKNTATIAFDTFIAAQNGDYSGFAVMCLAYDFMVPNALLWGDQAVKGGTADIDVSRDYESELDPEDSLFGSPLSKLIIGYTKYGQFTTGSIPPQYKKINRVRTETLLISGSIDFSTPMEYAKYGLLPYLKNGDQIVLYEMGHTKDVMNLQKVALINLVLHYFKEGIVDDSKFNYDPIDFKVKFSLQFIIKAVIAGIIGTIVLLGFIIFLIIKKIFIKRKRKKS